LTHRCDKFTTPDITKLEIPGMKKKIPEDKNESNQYSHVKRPNVPLSPEEHKLIAKYCIDNEIKIGDFLRGAGIYCVTNGIIP
jgi:hypothetical protein